MIRETISENESYDQDDTPVDAQPPLSPAGGAESLFLAGLATSKISADALSKRLRLTTNSKYPGSIERRSTSAASIRSVLTDDFQSCAQFSDDLDFPITDDEEDEHDEHFHNDNNSEDDTTFFSLFRSPSKKMSTTTASSSSRKVNNSTKATPVEPSQAAKEGMDVTEHVYEKAKGAWAWGKGVPLISIGLGITEAFVGKAASVAGTDLQTLDQKIKPQLEKFDHDVMDPAIKAVIGALMNAANKSEGFVKPIVIKILSPFGLIKNEAENPELTK